jgi:uncharacterized protein YndB with AHSA1/START domain
MERLPYIDTHRTELQAQPAEVWSALVASLRRDLGSAPPAMFVRVWRLEPAQRRGARDALEPGDALPGFEVAEAAPPRRLAFTGHHRFSSYALTFTLEPIDGGTRLGAETRAAFPGILGFGYRAAVIGTRMHRVMTRRMLRRVEEEL